jgi:hypothetical protein
LIPLAVRPGRIIPTSKRNAKALEAERQPKGHGLCFSAFGL